MANIDGAPCPEDGCNGKMYNIDYSFNHDGNNRFYHCSKCGYPWPNIIWDWDKFGGVLDEGE